MLISEGGGGAFKLQFTGKMKKPPVKETLKMFNKDSQGMMYNCEDCFFIFS